MKIKKGDEVLITSGKEKGKRGKIESVFLEKNMVVVGGMNQYKRHMKARSQSQKSEIATITKPLPVSIIMVVCPKCNMPTRIGFLEKTVKGKTSGRKVRICKKCEKEI